MIEKMRNAEVSASEMADNESVKRLAVKWYRDEVEKEETDMCEADYLCREMK